ncbi:MAG: ribonuclease T [Terriglobia bacterium]|nr:MAG: ribonuclease T [Terriglobia bacterium]
MSMRTMIRRLAAGAMLICLIASGSASARSHKKKQASQFSYYLLVLSDAPDFCDQHPGNQDPRECGVGRHIGFVVHGLWPQGENSRGPENCGPASPVPPAVVQATLGYVPTESLIQHEWAAHGTCSGLSAADYFAALRKARDSVTLPADLSQPAQELRSSPAEIESKMAASNPSFPRSAFRTSCYSNSELEEVRVCLNKDLSPRSCGPSAGECSAASVILRPVR